MVNKLVIAFVFVAIIAVAMLGAGWLFLELQRSSPGQPTPTPAPSPHFTAQPSPTPPREANLEYVGELHLAMDPVSIPELIRIINSSADNYTRERAAFALSDISMQTASEREVRGEVIPFLKQVAYNEENGDVRLAAYTGVQDIRVRYPAGIAGNLSVSAPETARSSQNVTVTLHIYSAQEADAGVGVTRITYLTNESDQQAVVVSRNPTNMHLGEGESRDVPFITYFNKPGDYELEFRAKLSLDRVDYAALSETVYVRVE